MVSKEGNKYNMVLYEYDKNAILAEPIKNRTSPELPREFQAMEKKLTARELRPKLMKLDNEASQFLKSYLHNNNIAFQLVPPYSHRRNSAERAIRSLEDHLIAGISLTEKAFPMHLWDILLHQAVITLDMLHISWINPKLSASTHIDGQYDYNREPMAPPVKESLHIKHQIAEEHGRHMDKMDGTLSPPWNIIDSTRYILLKQEVKGWYKHLIFSPQRAKR
jgi:hypothetical protein